MIKRFITPALLVITVLCSHIAHAALIRVSDGETVSVSDLTTETETVWDIDNDKLRGAYNVNIDDTLWDVRFSEGTFAGVFPDPTGLEERSHLETALFAIALRDVVLNPVRAGHGTFEVSPHRVLGCHNATRVEGCAIIIPYGHIDVSTNLGGVVETLDAVRAWTVVTEVDSGDVYTRHGLGRRQRPVFVEAGGVGIDGMSVWAVWNKKEVVDVPAPATIAIFSLGLMGLASRRFKKQS